MRYFPHRGRFCPDPNRSKSTENEDLAERVLQFADYFHRLNGGIVDLMDVVSDRILFRPWFGGSASLKSVLPFLIPDMSYYELEVNNGTLASLRWLQMRIQSAPVRVQKIRQHLLDYCQQDTLAMVELLKAFELFA